MKAGERDSGGAPAPMATVAKSAALPEGGALRFRVETDRGLEEAFAIRYQGEVRAYLNVCTHRALELDLGAGTFFSEDGRDLVCRAHGARFHPLDGGCVGGICKRGSGLTPLEVAERDGLITVANARAGADEAAGSE